MKAESARRRSTFPVRSKQVVAADRVFDRIKILTGELEALHADLHRQAQQHGGVAASHSQALSQFKRVLDQLRRILWPYLDDADAQAQPAQAHAELAGRHQDIANRADLLEISYPQGNLSTDTAEPGSFFDRLNVVVDAYMQRNQTGAPASRKRGKI